MASILSLCNEALSQIAAGQIASLTEPSIEARECNRFADTLLEEMADWTEWAVLIKRDSLAAVANDRPAEWLYAYAAPSDMAAPIAIRMVEDDAQYLPAYGLGDYPVQDIAPIPFCFEGGKIYTNVETATLVYARNKFTVAEMAPLPRRAFVLELAARIALPIKKEAKLAQSLQNLAETARARAIADEENKNPRRATRYVSEAEWARMGVGL